MQDAFHIEGCKQTKIIDWAVYVVSFFVTWALYVFFVQKYLGENYPFLFSIIKMGFAKITIWTIPVLLYLKYHDKVKPIVYLKLKGTLSLGLIYVIIAGSVYLLIGLVQQYILFKHIQFHAILNMEVWFNGIILAGFTEELLFRGFFLQKLSSVISFWKANVITAFLFLSIHFPGWIYRGTFTVMNIDILGIFILGIVSGYILKKTNSLWACIFIHAINNFISLSLR